MNQQETGNNVGVEWFVGQVEGLEAYQAIRAAMAEEVAMRTNLHSFTASESGAVARERGERRESTRR